MYMREGRRNGMRILDIFMCSKSIFLCIRILIGTYMRVCARDGLKERHVFFLLELLDAYIISRSRQKHI